MSPFHTSPLLAAGGGGGGGSGWSVLEPLGRGRGELHVQAGKERVNLAWGVGRRGAPVLEQLPKGRPAEWAGGWLAGLHCRSFSAWAAFNSCCEGVGHA